MCVAQSNSLVSRITLALLLCVTPIVHFVFPAAAVLQQEVHFSISILSASNQPSKQSTVYHQAPLNFLEVCLDPCVIFINYIVHLTLTVVCLTMFYGMPCT